MGVLSISAVDTSTLDPDIVRDMAPYYNFGATVAKYRRLPRTPANVKAHAEALFAQLRTFQQAVNKAPPLHCPCASGTWLSGKPLLAAIRRQHATRLAQALDEDHARRTDKQVGAALADALAGKEARLVSEYPR